MTDKIDIETPDVLPLTEEEKKAIVAELAEQQTKPKAVPTAFKPRVKAGKPVVQPQPRAFAPAASSPDQLLVEILTWPRRHDTPAELAFKDWLLALPMVKDLPRKDLSLGSWAWEVGTGPACEDVMFSCHIDTQDASTSCTDVKAKKKLTYDVGLAVIGLDAKHPTGTCLGADDGTGIWIMLRMIEAKVPGTYVFHRGEECGGLSAHANVKDHADYFKKRQMAIAFDRAGDTDVIIHQGGSTCASNNFGNVLASELNQGTGFNYKASTQGVFTDTKVYRGLINECVNLSVGYANQHGVNEYQDWDHLERMVKRCIAIKWHKLPVLRSPYIAPEAPAYTGAKWDSGRLQDDFFGAGFKDKRGGAPMKTSSTAVSRDLDYSYSELFAMVDDDPEKAKDVMAAYMRERARLIADIKVLESIVEDLR